MSESHNERRLDEIIRLLHKGKKAHEIEEIFAGRKRRHAIIKETKGKPHEQNVQKLLAGLLYVSEALILKDQVQQDEKRDIKITLQDDLFHSQFGIQVAIPRSTLWTQVKSSKSGIKGYKADIIAKYGLEPNEVELWMREHRQVILNGSSPDQGILGSFETQLSEMNEYWTHRPK